MKIKPEDHESPYEKGRRNKGDADSDKYPLNPSQGTGSYRKTINGDVGKDLMVKDANPIGHQ